MDNDKRDDQRDEQQKPPTPTALPDERERRREIGRQADVGSHGLTGGANRSNGNELERGG
jgi:hypothetical protein